MGRNVFPLGERRRFFAAVVVSLLAVVPLVPLQRALAGPPATADEETGVSGAGSVSAAPDQGESGLGDMAADTDPTKPVFFGFRDEFYDLGHGLWRNVALLRVDQAVLKTTHTPGLKKGFLLRADLPLVTFHDGKNTKTGLGDILGQVIIVPRITGPVFVGIGSAFVAPTATGDTLGVGKWMAAPAVVPVVFFPHKGWLYVKVQDWISFAGSPGRPDLHYLTVTPTLLRRISKRCWMGIDGESSTNWEKSGETGYKAGLLVGVMLSRRFGASIKGEIPFGAHRQGDWTVKAVSFMTRF